MRKDGQRQFYQGNRQQHRQQGKDHRFTDKLFDQLPAESTEHLPHPHFPRPAGRAGGGKVHKIDAGDQQDEQTDGGDNPQIRHPGVRLDLPFHMGLEMNILQRHQQRGAFAVRPGEGILFHKGFELIFKRRSGMGFRKHDVGIERGIKPPLINTESQVVMTQRQKREQDIGMKMGIGRHIFHHRAHLECQSIVQCQRFSQRIFFPKIFSSLRGAQYHCSRIIQKAPGISPQQREAEHLKKSGIGKGNFRLHKLLFAHSYQFFLAEENSHYTFYFRVIYLQLRRQREWGLGIVKGSGRDSGLHRNTVDPLALFMESIITQLMPNVERDQQAAGHPDRQADDVDQRVDPLLD